MAVKIEFDSSHNAIQPTLVLATRGGRKLGSLPAYNLVFKDCFNAPAELSFKINKVDCVTPDGVGIWDQVVDFKLIWVREWNRWFESYVEMDESNDFVKSISAKALGEAELSQINLYNIEINTEDDIARDDYTPAVLYNPEDPSSSILNRIMEKTPHYNISHVDSSIASIQRTFTFDNTSIYDALQSIAEEIECLFSIDCWSDDNGKIHRDISAYDLKSYCLDCKERGDFQDRCGCGSTNIVKGYGKDTSIFVSTTNLADSINYSIDSGAVKNCFKLEAGDDLMTATVVNCNPNGSGYIWCIPDSFKQDMSDELVQKLKEYDELYDYYQTEYQPTVHAMPPYIYNRLADKYSNNEKTIPKMPLKEGNNRLIITGYPEIMEYYYNIIDFYLYLNNEMMPSAKTETTDAQQEAHKLSDRQVSSVYVRNIDSCSLETANSAILGVAKTVIDRRYRVEIKDSTLSNVLGETRKWEGSFVVTNYSDDTDTATSEIVEIAVNGKQTSGFVKQQINKALHKIGADETTDIVQLFGLEESAFIDELKKYSLARLTAFHDACQSCLDILIQQGISDNKADSSWEQENLYDSLYLPYWNKLGDIETEMSYRETEITIVLHLRDDFDLTIMHIQDALDFEKYLGNELLSEFAAYRREDTYSNENYISDGLNNAELFQRALEFINVAKNDIYKSANLQHSISATLKNLLVMREFQPIVDNFEVGNWIRICVDSQIYRLRLIDYEIDFDSLDNISVTFSDVTTTRDGVSDVKSILDHAASMSTSYGSVSRQARKGEQSNQKLNDFAENGIALTQSRIVDDGGRQTITYDKHGLLFREYDDITEQYLPTQFKITNSTLALTDDNWKTTRSIFGLLNYNDPNSGQQQTTYGVSADALIGKMILGQSISIASENDSLTFDDNGLYVRGDRNEVKIDPRGESIFVITRDGSENILALDSTGNLNIKGTITGSAIRGSSITVTSNNSKININGNRSHPLSITNTVYDEEILYVDENGDLSITGTIHATNGYFTGTIEGSEIKGGLVEGASIKGGKFSVSQSTGYFGDHWFEYASYMNIDNATVYGGVVKNPYYPDNLLFHPDVTQASATGYLSFDVYSASPDIHEYGAMLAGKGLIVLASPHLAVAEYTQTGNNDRNIPELHFGYTGDIQIPVDWDLSNDGITVGFELLRFKNGICLGVYNGSTQSMSADDMSINDNKIVKTYDLSEIVKSISEKSESTS